MSELARLFTDERRPDVPVAERQAISREILAHVLASVGSQEIAAAGDVLDWAGGTFAKGVALAPEILPPRDYPQAGGYRERRDRRRAILYVSELGGVSSFVNADPWAERQVLHGGFEFLRGMAQNLDIVQAIIATRQHQSTPYFRRYREDDANPTGYRWIREDGEKLSKADLKEVDRLDAVLQNCGTDTDPITRRYRSRRRTFRGFMEALIADSLTFDACPIETERSNNGKLIGWRNIDATMIRLAFEEGYEGDDQIVAVQITPERQAIVGFEADEIVYEVRNPRSSIFAQDYGESELESLVRAMTLYLNTCTFNAASLDRNTVPRGILTLHGKYTQPQLLDFQSKWQALLNGAARRFKIPVLTSPSKAEGGATWTKLDEIQTEQTKWLLVYVASMACARYCMAPEVINIESFSAGKSSLAGSDTQEKLQSSHDKGLVPLLDWCFDGIVNPYLIHQLSPKYRIVPVGLFPQDEARKHERQLKVSTVNELRQIDGADPHPITVIGDAPADPAFMALYMQAIGMQDPGAADDPDGDAGDEDARGDRLAENLPPGERPLSTVRLASADRERPAARPNGVVAARPKPAAVAGGRQLAKARTDAPKLVVEIRDLGPADGWPDGMG